jgi:23S rRNA pseudouridine2605 synthase
MPKKTKKSAEADAAEPTTALPPEPTEAATEPQAEATDAPAKKTAVKKSTPRKTAAKKKSKKSAVDAELELGVELPAPSESSSQPETVNPEAVAQAADTFEAAIESNNAAELEAAAPVNEAAPELEALDDDEDDEDHEHFEAPPRPPAKLERLQKILAQAGIASRRHAEEMITEGRVQVNGKIVTELGSKADSNRDHIRVDGKLLHGAERLRYFMLNKPRGYVTTVSDPEGRPTVMEFFKKAPERLYPVGRLDYLSEGLLLMTNDGELANKLTRAASGVEKTYLVKVSGQPTEEEIESLRQGISIDRGKPGEGSVRTSPARIRQVRIGENPWYEVVLIEGRNRELRKMFEEIGHFVEKIRRVGYGPLVLDQEPGNLRELDLQELNLLRLAADGKWKPKRIKSTAMLPKEAGRTVDPDAGKRRPGKPFLQPPGQDRTRPEARTGSQDRGPSQPLGFAPRGDNRGQRRDTTRGGDTGRSFGRPAAGGERRGFSRPPADRAESRGFSKPPTNRGEGFTRPPADRGGERRSFSRPQGGAGSQRPFRGRPATGGASKPRSDRPAFPPRLRRPEEGAGFGERKPFRPGTDRPAEGSGDKPRFGARPGKPVSSGFGEDRRRPPQGAGRSFGPRPEGRSGEKPAFPPRRDSTSSSRTSSRPPAGGRAAFTSSGVPRPGGARPPSGAQGRTGFQGRGPTGGSRPGSGPRPGSNGSSRPGFKGKPGGRGPSRGGSSGRKRT